MAKTVTATVAPGRSVYADPVSSKAWDADSKREVDVVKPGKPKGPGETVTLPEAEAKRLIDLGFLLAPNAAVIPTAPGPTFSVNEGPQIKVA